MAAATRRMVMGSVAVLASISCVFDVPTWAPASPLAVAGVPGERLVERECDTAPVLEPMRCYWIEVPERRDVSGARTIRLWVAVMGEADPELSPVVDIAGGPGQTASTSWVTGEFSIPLIPGRVLITMDPRGVGRSEPRLSCPPYDGFLPPTAPREARSAQSRLLDAQCRATLVSSGVDLDGYDTVETAADYVALRKLLGIDQWVIRAGSYGGRLAREVYRQDPDGVEAMALFSPKTTAPYGPAVIVKSLERAVARITTACDAQPSCAINGHFADNLAAAGTLLDASPFELPDGELIDGGTIHAGLYEALSSPDLIPLLPAVAAQLASGNTAILPAMAGALDVPPPDDVRDELSDAVSAVVNCADDGEALTDADRAVLDDPGPWEDVIGAWVCDVWDVDPVPGGQLQQARGHIPVLVISGAFDPRTPPEFADEFIAAFPNTTSLVIPSGGHSSGYFVDCTRILSIAFILDPATELDTSCIDELPQPFAEP